jgi:hypothetical protein
MRRPGTPDRRSVLLGVALSTGAFTAGCSGSGRRLGEPAAPRASSPKGYATPSVNPSIDRELRSRAIAQQQGLLAAVTSSTVQEPFASVRNLHAEHLKRLSGSPAKLARPPAKPLPAAQVAALERSVAVTLRADCLRASPELAPLLASLAASSEIAAILLAP